MARIESVDVFRFLAIISVITIHVHPFSPDVVSGGGAWVYLDIAINQFSRFAVPFFFVISGYFWGVSIRNGTPVASVSGSMARRVLIIFVSWSLIYAVLSAPELIMEQGLSGTLKIAYWNLVSIVTHGNVTLFVQGTKAHLWFLPALLFALGISAFFVERGKYRALVYASVVLYLIGLAAKAYSNTPLGFHADFNTRNGPFFGTILFVAGYFVSGLTPSHEWFVKGLALFAAGCAMHFLEVYFLWKAYGASPYQDYVVGTFLMGLGAAIASLSNHSLLRNKVLGGVGKYTLGIYAVHFAFVDMLGPLGNYFDTPLWDILYIALVFLFSFALVKLLSLNRITRRIVV